MYREKEHSVRVAVEADMIAAFKRYLDRHMNM